MYRDTACLNNRNRPHEAATVCDYIRAPSHLVDLLQEPSHFSVAFGQNIYESIGTIQQTLRRALAVHR